MTILQNSWEDKKKGKGLKNLATICYEVSHITHLPLSISKLHVLPLQTMQYLTECPAPIKSQTTEKIIEFRKEMQPYKLSDAEIFMMVNDPPSSLLHIQLLIEDSEERLTEDQVNEILQVIERLLVPPPVVADPEQNSSTENQEEDEEDGNQEEGAGDE